MNRVLGFGVLGGLVLAFQVVAGGAGKDAAKVKEALQALQDYIGNWKGNGTSEKNKSEIWNEKLSWSWKFKGDDAWLTLDFGKDGKFYKGGEVRYLPDKKLYKMTLVDKKDKKQVFEGRLTGAKKDRLTLERVDPDTKETHQILMNMAAGGIGSVYTYSTKPENRTLYNKQWQVRFTKEGESFAAGKKQIECVVTGGLGTIPVMFKGVTYYVCCTGCRDAFNENPEKILKEYFAKKKASSQ
jgi:outer membrane lipoprotein-sorting protein